MRFTKFINWTFLGMFMMALRKLLFMHYLFLFIKALESADLKTSFHKLSILANACWGTPERWKRNGDYAVIPITQFTEKDLYRTDKFHVWCMD